jgi:hypothetical protein
MRESMNVITPPQKTRDRFMKFMGIKNLMAFPQKVYVTNFLH